MQQTDYCPHCNKGKHSAIACDVLFGRMLRYRGLMKADNLPTNTPPQMNLLETEDETESAINMFLQAQLGNDEDFVLPITNDDDARMGW